MVLVLVLVPGLVLLRSHHELPVVVFPEYFLCSVIVAPAISEVQLPPRAISIDVV